MRRVRAVFGTISLLVTGGALVVALAQADTNLGSAGGLTYVADDTPLDPAPSAGRADADCPGGDHVVGGGATIFLPISQAHLNSIYPFDGGDANATPDDGWASRASNNIGDGKDLRVFAICGSPAPDYRTRSAQVGTGDAVATKARCRGRTHVSGGGVHVTGAPGQAHVNATFPIDGRDRGDAPDDGWRARVSNDSGGGKQMTVFAICARMKLAYRSQSFDAPPGGATSQDVNCPETAHVTGGGVKATGSASGGQVEGIRPLDTSDADEVPDDAWLGTYGNNAGPSRTARTFAICKKS
jgi:hypothetical protein